MVGVHKTCNSVLSRALALSAYRERRPFQLCFLLLYWLKWLDNLPGQVMKRSNLNVVGPPIKVIVERRVLDVVLWPLRIVMLSVMLPQDRSISSISSVCAKDPLYWLPRMPGPGRPTYSPYSLGHFKQSNPCLLSPGRLTKHTKDLFSFQALCSPLLTESFWTRPWESQRNITADTQFCAEICDWLTLRGPYCMNEAGVQCGFV